MGRLQRFTTNHVTQMLAGKASEQRVGHAIGNAMSLNVVVRLLPWVLYAARLVAEEPRDPWKHVAKAAIQSMRVLPDDVHHP